MRKRVAAELISQLVGWCVGGAIVTGILFYFGSKVNEYYAREWDQIHRQNIVAQTLHVVSSKSEYSSSSSQRHPLQLNFANARGKVVTWRGVGNNSKLHVGSILSGYDLGITNISSRISTGRFLRGFMSSCLRLLGALSP
jgi:hypothetical protein